MGAMYGTVTGTHGFTMDQALSNLGGGEYHELQHWTQRSSTGRFSANLQSQLFAGDGYWASSDAAHIFSDAFPAHLLVVYELQVSLTNDAQVRLAAVRGDIDAPPERQVHILHDWHTGHYQLLERMENTHIDDLRNSQISDRLRDPLWAQRVFDTTPNPQAYVPSIIPVQHRLNLSWAVGNRAAAQQLFYETPAHADDQEGDAAAEDSTERLIKTRALAIPRIVQKPEFRQVNAINFEGVRLQLGTQERFGAITAEELRLSGGRPPLIQFGKRRLIDLCDASPDETQKQHDKRNRAHQLLRQLDSRTGKLVGMSNAPSWEIDSAWEVTRFVPDDVESLDTSWPGDQADIRELGVNDALFHRPDN